MVKKIADEKFNSFFDSTYDDAVAYVAGMTGTFDIVEKVLSKTYARLYRYLRLAKEFDRENMEKFFLKILKDNTSAYIPELQDKPLRNFSKSLPKDPEEVLKEELDITESEFLGLHKNMIIHSYIMSYPADERKIYILYFYCSYTPEKISELLSLDEEYIKSCITLLLTEIKEKFFKAKKPIETTEVKFNL